MIISPESVLFHPYQTLMKKLFCPSLPSINYKIMLGLTLAFLLGACSSNKTLSTVSKLDIQQYAGTWYEIARLPNTFEKGMQCVSATYTPMENGRISVLNKGWLTEKNKWKEITGTARVPDPAIPGQLKVQFFWPFSGDYYVMALDENYQYALVGDPSRKYLWVLSKKKNMDENMYASLLNTAEALGFAVDKILKIEQGCSGE